MRTKGGKRKGKGSVAGTLRACEVSSLAAGMAAARCSRSSSGVGKEARWTAPGS